MEESIVIPIRFFYPDQIGGPSNTMFWHAKSLVNKGVTVSVVTMSTQKRKGIRRNEFCRIEGIRVIYTTSTFRFLFYSFLEIHKSSIVHLNSLFYWPNLLFFGFGRMFKKSVIWSVRGELEPAALRFRPRAKRVLLALLRNIKGTCVFHGTSENEIKGIHEVLKAKSAVHLPNYIPFGKDLLSLGSVKKKRQILFLGRIHPIKNLEFLIDVLAHSDLEGVKLLIAGTGKQDYINSLKELVKKYRLDCVEFAGHLEGDQKNKALETSMCLVLPSRSENFGNVVIEALAMGTTVITSNKTPWSILEEKDVGWYLPLEREQWVRVLQDYFIHANSEMINSQSKKAKKLVFEKFSTDVGAEKWLEVLNSLRK